MTKTETIAYVEVLLIFRNRVEFRAEMATCSSRVRDDGDIHPRINKGTLSATKRNEIGFDQFGIALHVAEHAREGCG
jgi:hypothetical protein